MPAKSKRQFRMMQAVAHGSAKVGGLSKGEAAEYVKGQSPKGLPEKAASPRELITRGLKTARTRKRRK